jgi:hypothetical protein
LYLHGWRIDIARATVVNGKTPIFCELGSSRMMYPAIWLAILSL